MGAWQWYYACLWNRRFCNSRSCSSFTTCEAGSSYYVRMMYSRDKTGGWMNPVILVSDQKTGAKAGDLMTCTVEVEGTDEEQDAKGETVQVPRMRLLVVDRLE